MAGVFSNRRRRLLAGMLAAGFAGSSALAQSATRLPKCERWRGGTGDELGERYRAFIYPTSERASALVPALENGSIPGFTRGKYGIKLVADSDGEGRATGLALRLEGARPDSKALIGEMRFTVTVNGRPSRSLAAPHFSGDFVQLGNVSNILPSTFADLREDVRVGIYLPGTPQTGAPTHVRTYSKDRIAEASRLAQIELTQLREKHARGECETIPLGCFLTTAAVDMLDLADDCWELRTLRRYRDGWLAQQEGGAELIAEYYARAPAIAAQLRDDPQRLARLYLSHILPAAMSARLGCNRAARALYSRMMRKVADLG